MLKKTPKSFLRYHTYNFIDKDPVVDVMRTLITNKKFTMKELHEISGVSPQTIRNLFYGETKKPRFSTVMALARAMGYEFKLVKWRG
jgi:transcriptional regulator with XRE-family HTH domain